VERRNLQSPGAVRFDCRKENVFIVVFAHNPRRLQNPPPLSKGPLRAPLRSQTIDTPLQIVYEGGCPKNVF
jgi:hypothetical protein